MLDLIGWRHDIIARNLHLCGSNSLSVIIIDDYLIIFNTLILFLINLRTHDIFDVNLIK